MRQQTFVGLHIPKCAGTSFLDMAREVVPRHQLFQNTSIIMNWNDGRPEFLDIGDYAALRVVWGHSVHEQMLHRLKNPILFTGMREPVARLISEARYQVDLRERQGMPFDLADWMEKQRNPMTWFIINRFPILAERENRGLSPFDKAQRALKSFHHVYFTDTFNQSVKAIFDALGIATPPKQSNVGVKQGMQIEVDLEPLAYDIELYQWAREEFGSRLLDPEKPTSEPLARFLDSRPQPDVLEEFLFRTQAGEYYGWSALDRVAEDRVIRATRLLKEAEVYRKRKEIT